ncbi:hypothetical protein CTAYLR_006112 [Chrysophaeum taylorii]|uniref:Uncharacterized protein n=1 Tax=Chrysophaeum taylorii TaxID=2483200 RepID=A0AAD7U9J0_9STRA|nr:hypothetical protein CTAYLR_006112 [Chrysophaeum taylorii]
MASWEVEIAASHVRVFSAAVQALACVGREISFTVEAEGAGTAMMLTAMNDNAASFASFRFEPRFFARTRVRRATAISCKVVARALVPALRRATAKAAVRSRQVAGVMKVVVRHDDDEVSDDDNDELRAPRLVVEVFHEDGIRARWRLFYEMAEAEDAAFDERDAGRVSCHPMQLASVFEHVTAHAVEVHVTGEDLGVSSRAEDDAASTKLKIAKDDLDSLELPRFESEAALAFNAKEAKAAVKFCQAADVSDMTFQFTRAGKPVAFSGRAPSGATARFLISTSRSVRHNNRGPSQRPPSASIPSNNQEPAARCRVDDDDDDDDLPPRRRRRASFIGVYR